MKLTEVKKLLENNGYAYQQTVIPRRAEFYSQKGFRPSVDTGAFSLLTIQNPNHDKNIEIVFSDASDNPDFYDLEFGGFWYEMFGYRDEHLPRDLLDEIQRIVTGKANVIFATNAKTGKWFADQIYFDLPETDMNDMDDYKRTLSRISAPKSLWRKLIGRTDVYEIFNWFSYQKIVK